MAAASKTPISARKATLEAMQSGIEARLVAIETELESPQDPDWADRAIARESDEVLEATGRSGQHDLRQIEAALRRIEAGTYGTCAKCAQDIEEERLDILPATPFCRVCAK